jgi:hypothetical protein
MTQNNLNRAVAARTGESIGTIARRGFSLESPKPREDGQNSDSGSWSLLTRAVERCELRRTA